MALWQKAWIESRSRFLLGVGVVGGACLYASHRHQFVYQGLPRTTFVMFCFLLGMGGLLREGVLGTTPFTLALPVTRARQVVTRAAIGWLELVALAFVPSLLVTLLPPTGVDAYPIGQALQFTLLWIAGGSALFATAFLASSILAGEYTPFIVAWIAFFAHTVTTQYVRLTHPALNPYLFTIQEMMSGFRMPYFDPQQRLIVGAFPIAIVALLAASACVLVGAAAWWTDRRDF